MGITADRSSHVNTTSTTEKQEKDGATIHIEYHAQATQNEYHSLEREQAGESGEYLLKPDP